MTNDSIYKKYLGSDFNKLHPMMQQRFGLGGGNGAFMIGRGQMDRIWNGGFHTLPFLYFGTLRNIMFPEKGTNIPFTIENYNYMDSFGRETVAWIRSFHFGSRVRHFDATMILSKDRNKIVDYLGTYQHLAVDINMNVNSDGSVSIRSGPQRFYEGKIAFEFPQLLAGNADVNERYDEATGLFHISVRVSNKYFGNLFGYNGWFRAEFGQVDPVTIPAHIRPKREEIRE